MSDYRTDIVSRMTKVMAELPEKCLPFADILVEALELHNKKSKDYGSDDDPYKNVRASEEFGIPAWCGGLLRVNDKITRLKQFSKRGNLANESAEDSMIDCVVYFAIILMLYREASSQDTPTGIVDGSTILSTGSGGGVSAGSKKYLQVPLDSIGKIVYPVNAGEIPPSM